MSAALQDAVLCLNNTCLFTAMADDDNGIRCVGVFTTKDAAAQALEKLINNDVFTAVFLNMILRKNLP